jgi:predicted transcriptional regulator
MTPQSALNSPNPKPVSLDSLAAILGDAVRWKVLAKLSDGEPMTVAELARRFGRNPSAMSKHMAFMRKHQFVQVGPGRLYRLAAHLRPANGERDLNFGFCVLRTGTL